MEIIAIFKESEIYANHTDRIITSEDQYGEPRKAVRIVLLDENGDVALGYYAPAEHRFGGYNIPGGGVNDGEDIHGALIRESKEETGCNIFCFFDFRHTLFHNIAIIYCIAVDTNQIRVEFLNYFCEGGICNCSLVPLI